jgi:L-lactate dehydrogenase (cytochrome)
LKPREIRKFVSVQRPEWRLARRRLRRCFRVSDLRKLASRRVPIAVFDYVEGGADEELSISRNEAAFRQWEFIPTSPADVSSVDISTTILGRKLRAPLICSPTGYTRMMHSDGELAVARAAARAGIPYTLSTVASTSIEDVASSGHPDLWFQLYVWRDRGLTRDLVQRAWAAGYRVLEVSVDVPVSGYRIRDVRNGLTIPPRLTAKALLGIALKPSYWIDILRHPAITLANSPPDLDADRGVTIENMTARFEPALTWDDIAELRTQWPGALMVKGALSPSGAREAIAAGADGLHLSNHGGRQLDRVVPPIELLAQVRGSVGPQPTIVIDSGIRHGNDLAVAIALGADAGAVGRAYLYGLMAGGEAGVDRALLLLCSEFKRAVQLLGVKSVADLRAGGAQLLKHRAPTRADSLFTATDDRP